MNKSQLRYHFLLFLIFTCTTLSGFALDIQDIDPSQTISKFGDIAVDENGEVLEMFISHAISYCAGKGMHLPSARELALLSQSLGAVGISETAKSGYHLVKAKNADGIVDAFYFSKKGFNRPQGHLGSYRFWSSSRNYDFYFDAIDFDGKDGAVDNRNDDGRSAVLCALDK